MRLPALLLLVLAIALGMATTPAHAARTTGPCVPGEVAPVCQFTTGKVVGVNDGDTVDVVLDAPRRRVRVRLLSVQAMEQTVYHSDPRRRRGECNALEATARLDRLARLSRGRVRLSAQEPRSDTRGRWLRSVAFRIDGRWVDAGSDLVARGHALWMPSVVEHQWNDRLALLTQRAAAAGRYLFDTDHCGPGPSVDAALSMLVNADANGYDVLNLNDEWIRIRNAGVTDVPLGGWWVRDSGPRRYRFPSSTVIPAGGTLTVRVGEGIDTATDLHWGLLDPPFANPLDDGRFLGDGAYLFDPLGNMRAWFQYPCRRDCAAPLAGRVRLDVQPRGDEYVTLTNISPDVVDLDGHQLKVGGYTHTFGADSALAPGEVMRVDISGEVAQASRLRRRWDSDGPLLPNSGGAVELRSLAIVRVACVSWELGSC